MSRLFCDGVWPAERSASPIVPGVATARVPEFEEGDMSLVLLLAAMTAANLSYANTSGKAVETPLFPFVLPWNDSSPGITNLSGRLSAPAGRSGHIRAGTDGHLYSGSARIRFFGVDLAFSAALPSHSDAEQIAARMAKFGVNIVRFHIVDASRFPDGLLARDGKDTRHFDPEGLDRYDYFVAQLKKHGIYANLNLLNYRPIGSADGLPAEIDSLTTGSSQPRHAIGFFDRAVLELQREYARNLLTHRNAYTGHRYVDEPSVAFVEINNENGLLQAWLSGWLDSLPKVFALQLRGRWNAWLRQRYGTDNRLKEAWHVASEPLGAEMLSPGKPGEWDGWQLQKNAGADGAVASDRDFPEAIRSRDPGGESLRIASIRLGTESWHLLLNRPGFGVRADHTYTLSFWAKADSGCNLGASIYQTVAPYGSLGLSRNIEIGPTWKRYSYSFSATQDDPVARVTFGDFAGHLGTYWIAGVSLRPGRPLGLHEDESLTDGTIPSFTLSSGGERSMQAQSDWRRFLWETEDRYWQGMAGYLKHDLGVKSLVIGTAVGCSTPVIMSGLDVVDAHAYWEHPRFPGTPWDQDNWYTEQRSMVNEHGGTLPGLALKRVLGKPRAITEFCNPEPNGFGVEGYLLLAAYAAFQDWDYISMSRYAQKNDWDIRRFRGFFDIDQHPAKMATLIPASLLFRRADVRPARQLVSVDFDEDREVNLLASSHAWDLVDAGTAGISPETSLVHRVGIAARRSTAGTASSLRSSEPTPTKPGLTHFVSDTGELCWDLSSPKRGVVTVNTPESKAVIGYAFGRRFDLGGVAIEPGNTRQDGWSAITLTAISGSIHSGPARLLITATGIVENTNMGWKNAAHTTVGRDWGKAPTLAEGIPARFVIPVPLDRVQAWALDERGQRRERLPVAAVSPKSATLAIGPRWHTLWYEVDIR
ncbi:MAG: carbohydrate binding domain-containing protein [Fimbriimonas sp.]|nr:carbohydrate binding domain-containing protein [Fimbriimonas sp.]